MSLKVAVSFLSAGIFIGVIAVVLVQRVGQSNGSGATMVAGRPDGVGSTDQIAALRAQCDQRIAELTTENRAIRAEADALEGQAAKSPANTSDRYPPVREVVEEFRKRNIAAAKQRDTEKLLAAGYTRDRIEYLRRRSDELNEQFRLSQADQMKRGVWPRDPEKDLALAASLGVDPDFFLKDEIGDVEYERYLTALNRPAAVVVGDVSKGEVSPGIKASSLGIMSGDEIVTYNGKRVFNYGQLQAMSLMKPTDRLGGLVPVTVRRDGQMMQITLPKGWLGFFEPPPPIVTRLPFIPLPNAN